MQAGDLIEVDGVTLHRGWVTASTIARLHLLPAHAKDATVVIRRKPSKRFHIMLWRTRRNQLLHGSWFNGKLYPLRCDVSWDARWMVYLAMGDDGRTWNGLCQPPWLRTVIDCPNVGTWAGGGIFIGPDLLLANTCWHAEQSLADGKRPDRLRVQRLDSGGEDEPVLHARLLRDGWRRLGSNFGEEKRLGSLGHRYFVAHLNDDGWGFRPTRKHPELRMWYRGYFERGRTFEFELDSHPELFDASVEWATWDSKGDLLMAREGWIRRYTLADLRMDRCSFEADLDVLADPPPAQTSDHAATST